MKNRREFLGGCAAGATLMVLPAAAVLGSAGLAGGQVEILTAPQGERFALREGGSVVVARVDSIGVDPRLEQSLVQVLPSAPMDSGIYHLETPAGPQALYLEAGGSESRPTLTAAFSHLRV